MSDFNNAPLQNQFETQIVGEISSGSTVPFNITVKKAISFTPDSGGFRAILEPGTSKEEGLIITAVSGTTWTVGTRGVPIAKGGADTTTTHGGGAKIIITDTWSSFDDVATAVNSKLDQTGGTVSAIDIQVSGTNWRLREDAGDMKFTDDSTAEVSLSTLAAAAGVDTQVRVSNNDTTSGFLNGKLVEGNNITFTENNDGGNETLTIASQLPAGLVSPYGGSSAPTGWLLCDGTTGLDSVADTTLAALFAVIGTTFGGTGASDFDLPDMRGNFPLGKDNMGGSSRNRVTDSAADTVGDEGGSQTHTLAESEIPAHTHEIDETGSSAAGGGQDGWWSNGNAAAGSIVHATSSTGGGGAHENMSPYMTFNYIIKK